MKGGFGGSKIKMCELFIGRINDGGKSLTFARCIEFHIKSIYAVIQQMIYYPLYRPIYILIIRPPLLN